MRALPTAITALIVFTALSGCGPRPAPSGSVEDPANQLPFGYVDQPKPGDTVSRQVALRGWALDDGGVVQVRVYLDDHFWLALAINDARLDVMSAYPTLTRGTDKHGWWRTAEWPRGITSGEHVLLFQAVDTNGATRDINVVKVNVAP